MSLLSISYDSRLSSIGRVIWLGEEDSSELPATRHGRSVSSNATGPSPCRGTPDLPILCGRPAAIESRFRLLDRGEPVGEWRHAGDGIYSSNVIGQRSFDGVETAWKRPGTVVANPLTFVGRSRFVDVSACRSLLRSMFKSRRLTQPAAVPRGGCSATSRLEPTLARAESGLPRIFYASQGSAANGSPQGGSYLSRRSPVLLDPAALAPPRPKSRPSRSSAGPAGPPSRRRRRCSRARSDRTATARANGSPTPRPGRARRRGRARTRPVRARGCRRVQHQDMLGAADTLAQTARASSTWPSIRSDSSAAAGSGNPLGADRWPRGTGRDRAGSPLAKLICAK